MSVTVSNLTTLLNTYLGDLSTDRLADSERYTALSEAVVWLQEELGNEHMIETYDINYIDGVYYYKVTSSIPDILVGASVRKEEGENHVPFTHKGQEEMSNEIANGFEENAWAVERKNGDTYLVINTRNTFPPRLISSFDSTTSEGGTWTADTTGSDATNITVDSNEYKQGSASLNFDVDVSQSGNNKATLYRVLSTGLDLSSLEDIGSYILDVYIPDVTYVSSVTIRWSSDASGTPSTISNYWSKTSTTDYNGNALVSGWNKIKADWRTASITGAPDASSIKYHQIDINYSGSQTDDTDFRLDNLYLAKPETLTFHYVSTNIGTNSSGTALSMFTAGTDVPFFSGRYDNYQYAVAHKAASILYYSPLRLTNEGASEEKAAVEALTRYLKRFESTVTKEVKNFKPQGLNFRARRTRRLRRATR